MEETLGKRISANRKRLGMTQDQLAERLGVTAQAVSKWENDQSCPDIQTLPRLGEIFGITMDELLGASGGEKKTVEGVVIDIPEKESTEERRTFPLYGGKKFTLGLALWLLLSGAVLIILKERSIENSTWSILWPAGLLIFGLFGLYPKFSVFRLGCALAGGYFLGSALFLLPDLGLSMLLMILGGLLLIDAFRGKQRGRVSIPVAGDVHMKSSCETHGDRFTCNTAFGERNNRIDLPRLSGGDASLSFGEMELDLTGCREIGEGCHLNLEASFGKMTVLLPRCCRVQSRVKTCFAEFSTRGEPDADASVTVLVTGSASFGELCIRYI